MVVANSDTKSIGIVLGFGNGNFPDIIIYSTGEGSGSRSVTVGDFNEDGNLDIVVANRNIDSIGVILRFGNGTFKDQMIISTGSTSNPNYVTVGEFNNDNHLDIVVADQNVNEVGIVLGYGDGTFSRHIGYLTNDDSAPQFIHTVDFNNDKKLDIAVVNYGTSSFAVLYRLGDGTFLLGNSYFTGDGSLPYALAIGDFNNDTQLDAAVANIYANNIGIFLANGTGPFGNVKFHCIKDRSQSYSVVTGDLDNDGRADNVLTNYGIDNIGVSIGFTLQDFEEINSYSTGDGSAPWSAAVADFNDDTYLDMVVANSQTDNIVIFLNDGNGTFEIGMNYSTDAYSRPYTIATGDFNNDNVLDIAVATSGTSNILLLYGHEDGTFENGNVYPLGYDYGPYSIAVKDLDKNNWLDIVIACYGTDHVEILMNMCE